MFVRGSVAIFPHQRRRLELLYTPHAPHTNPPHTHPTPPKTPPPHGTRARTGPSVEPTGGNGFLWAASPAPPRTTTLGQRGLDASFHSRRLAGHKVLIQELAAVDGLARVDVLCLDRPSLPPTNNAGRRGRAGWRGRCRGSSPVRTSLPRAGRPAAAGRLISY